MKNPIVYINRRICRVLIHDYSELAKAMDEDVLSSYNAKASSPFSKDIPEAVVYDYLALAIARSINPFATVNHLCLEKSIEAYETIIPLIQDREVKFLANHHLTSTKNNLENLRRISKVKEMNKRFNFLA